MWHEWVRWWLRNRARQAAWVAIFVTILAVLLFGCTVYVTPVTMQPILCLKGQIHDRDTGQQTEGYRCFSESDSR